MNEGAQLSRSSNQLHEWIWYEMRLRKISHEPLNYAHLHIAGWNNLKIEKSVFVYLFSHVLSSHVHSLSFACTYIIRMHCKSLRLCAGNKVFFLFFVIVSLKSVLKTEKMAWKSWVNFFWSFKIAYGHVPEKNSKRVAILRLHAL